MHPSKVYAFTRLPMSLTNARNSEVVVSLLYCIWRMNYWDKKKKNVYSKYITKNSHGTSLEAFTSGQFLADSFPLRSWVNYSNSLTEPTYEWGEAGQQRYCPQTRCCHLLPRPHLLPPSPSTFTASVLWKAHHTPARWSRTSLTERPCALRQTEPPARPGGTPCPECAEPALAPFLHHPKRCFCTDVLTTTLTCLQTSSGVGLARTQCPLTTSSRLPPRCPCFTPRPFSSQNSPLFISFTRAHLCSLSVEAVTSQTTGSTRQGLC